MERKMEWLVEKEKSRGERHRFRQQVHLDKVEERKKKREEASRARLEESKKNNEGNQWQQALVSLMEQQSERMEDMRRLLEKMADK